MTAPIRRAFAGVLLTIPLLTAACGSSGATATASLEADTPAAATATPATTSDAPSDAAPSVDPGSGGAGPTPGGADVTGIDACALITRAEAEAALGVATKPPFGGGVQGVNIRTCMYQSTDGNGPQVGVAVSGAPDGFRPDLVAVTPGPPYSSVPTAVPGLGDEAWWWLDPQGFRLESRTGNRFVTFEFNDFRTADKPTEAALGALVPLMRTALSRLP